MVCSYSHADCFQNQIGHDPTCGTNLLNFYSAKMARTIRDFITVTVNIDFWNSRHTPGYSGFNVSTSVNSETLTDELMKFVDNSKLLNRTTVGKIVNSILDQVKFNKYLVRYLVISQAN